MYIMKTSKKYFFVVFILLIKFHSSKWVIKAKQDSQTIINSFELTKGKFSKAAIYYEFDSSNLQILLPETKEYLSNINDESEYPSSALLIFKDAINNAEKILLKESINQKELDEALSYLNLSFENIKKYKGYNNYDTNRGFIHPGGLYTNDDINRIKKQLQDVNEKVTAAYEILKKAEWSQLKAKTFPAEVIVRGISGQENYINAARGATIAFQSALRWKIEEDESFAKHAVEVLMAWANTTKKVDGNSDVALALGLYGYEFAQAGEIMRNYEGWSKEDFEKYKKWMLEVWYPFCVRFLRKR